MREWGNGIATLSWHSSRTIPIPESMPQKSSHRSRKRCNEANDSAFENCFQVYEPRLPSWKNYTFHSAPFCFLQFSIKTKMLGPLFFHSREKMGKEFNTSLQRYLSECISGISFLSDCIFLFACRANWIPMRSAKIVGPEIFFAMNQTGTMPMMAAQTLSKSTESWRMIFSGH